MKNVLTAGALVLAMASYATAATTKVATAKSPAATKAKEECMKENSKLAGKELRECIKKKEANHS